VFCRASDPLLVNEVEVIQGWLPAVEHFEQDSFSRHLQGSRDSVVPRNKNVAGSVLGEFILAELEQADIRAGARLGIKRSYTEIYWSKKAKPMSDEELKAELERLRNENAALKKGASTGIRMKVSEKGAVSIYGMGRFPVTLYKEQWLKLLDMSDDIRAFIAANDGHLKKKD